LPAAATLDNATRFFFRPHPPLRAHAWYRFNALLIFFFVDAFIIHLLNINFHELEDPFAFHPPMQPVVDVRRFFSKKICDSTNSLVSIGSDQPFMFEISV